MVAVNLAIDDFTGITNQLMKKRAEFKLAVRNVLTDKQKIIYDSKSNLFDGKAGCMNAGKRNAFGSGEHGKNMGEKNCPLHK